MENIDIGINYSYNTLKIGKDSLDLVHTIQSDNERASLLQEGEDKANQFVQIIARNGKELGFVKKSQFEKVRKGISDKKLKQRIDVIAFDPDRAGQIDGGVKILAEQFLKLKTLWYVQAKLKDPGFSKEEQNFVYGVLVHYRSSREKGKTADDLVWDVGDVKKVMELLESHKDVIERNIENFVHEEVKYRRQRDLGQL